MVFAGRIVFNGGGYPGGGHWIAAAYRTRGGW
jgi:hypothetical protein